MRKIVHYLLLSAVLFGVPLLCACLGGDKEIFEGLKNFPPRTEDWGVRPEKLWNFRRPFHWGWFLGMLGFTLACVTPLVRRALKRGFARPRPQWAKAPFPWWGWAGLAILAAGWVITWTRFECLKEAQVLLSYFPVWMGYIVTMNALVFWRRGSSPLTDHPLAYALTFPLSSVFWWVFEYLNRFVWNWYYLGVGSLSAFTYTLYATLCFASVLPGVYATAEFLGTFRFFDDRNCEAMAWRPDVRHPLARLTLFVLSALGLTGIVFFPDYAYPLLWISPLMTFVLIQVTLGEASVLDELKSGNWGLVFRFEVASLCCGLCWETWNYYALAKWVYAVPWVHRWQIWEMPLVGFAGYLPFGVECAAVTAWLYESFGLSLKGRSEKGGE